VTGRQVGTFLGSFLFLLLFGLPGCTAWQAGYLKAQVHKASEEDVRSRLGRPTQVKQFEDGGTEWLYHVFSDPMFDFGYKGQPAEPTCKEYILTFNERRILTYWIAQDCE
jgi:outer membrane protein assembly factor BamE (lipoprotein component of BamABCDE complex)